MSAERMGEIESAFCAEMGGRLEIQRKRAGWSRQGLAMEIGVHRNTIMRWETGEYPISIWMLLRLCDVLHCQHLILLPPREFTWGSMLAPLMEERDPQPGAADGREG